MAPTSSISNGIASLRGLPLFVKTSFSSAFMAAVSIEGILKLTRKATQRIAVRSEREHSRTAVASVEVHCILKDLVVGDRVEVDA